MKKYIILILIIIVGILGIGVFLNSDGDEYSDYAESTSDDDGNYVYQNNNYIASANNIFLTDGRLVYFADMAKENTYPVCVNPDCEHSDMNNCGAIFSDTCSLDFITRYDDKIIVGGTSSSTLDFYECDTDGSDHKQLLDFNFKEDIDAFQKNTGDNLNVEVSDSDYLCNDSYIYVCLNIENVSDIKQLEDGTMSSGPSVVVIYRFNLENGKLEKIHEYNDSMYWVSSDLRYISDGNLYIDLKSLKCEPQEYPEYDGEMEDESKNSKIIERVECLNIKSFESIKDDSHVCFDFIGTVENENWFIDIDENYNFTGNVFSENTTSDKENIVKLEGIDSCKYSLKYRVVAFDDGFVYEVERNTGDTCSYDIYVYDSDGNRKNIIENSEYAVIGCTGKYFLLANSEWSKCVDSYIPMNEIDKIDSKLINFWE